MPLPELPKITLELVADLSSPDAGFLRIVRRQYRAHYPGGGVSEAFVYDSVDRRSIDAVVIVAHYQANDGEHVFLRSAVRPPLTLRSSANSPLTETGSASLWELPAGLIDGDERHSLDGVKRAAARELEEELGFAVDISALEPLGVSTFPAPGMVAERHFFFRVRVSPDQRQEPALDGSALEKHGLVVDVGLDEALAACRSGVIEDEKTELALRRLAEHLASDAAPDL